MIARRMKKWTRITMVSFVALAIVITTIAPTNANPLDPDTTSAEGRTRLQVFGGFYGAYLGIVTPSAANAGDLGYYSLSLLTLPWIGYATGGKVAQSHNVSRGDAMTVSSLTWFGAVQGHLWHAASKNNDANVNAAMGLAGSLTGLALGSAIATNNDLTEGHAAAIGGGNWWGIALGGLAANDEEDTGSDDLNRGRAIGSAAGATLGAITGRHLSMNDVRYMHLGGLMGWLYAAGLNVLNEPSQRGSTYTQMAGISIGMAATLTASKLRWGEPDNGRALDHSGRLRLQFFSLAYGTYLATLVPIAAGTTFNEDNRDTFALAYMHIPTGGVLATTFLTRNIDVPQSSAIAISSLTWFGAIQGALWSAAADIDGETTATISLAGSAIGLTTGVILTNKTDITEGQAAMIGAGNWWGSVLGFLAGNAIVGESITGEEIALMTASGNALGTAIGASIGRPFELSQVHRMHMGGFIGWLVGTAALLGGNNTFRGANIAMAITTTIGLVLGASRHTSASAPQGEGIFQNTRPYLSSARNPDGTRRTLIGISSSF